MKIKVLVVDDSPFVRRLITDWVKADPELELVGEGATGRQAIDLNRSLKPDVITLDIEMPEMNGLDALAEIVKNSPAKVIMVSSLTTQGAEATLRALDLGAIDFVTKPGSGVIRGTESRDELLAKIKVAYRSRSKPTIPREVLRPARAIGSTDKVILVATSTGGPKALTQLFQGLPNGFPAPILIVQHMPTGFTEGLARRLNDYKTVPCREAKHGDRIEPGLALLAPGGRHMRIRRGGTVELDDAPPLHGVRPAADYLFFSGAEVYGPRCIGVVMTGMGGDGAQGAVALRKRGAICLGESESTCVVYGMPRVANESGGIDAEFPIHELAAAVTARLSRSLPNAS